MSPVSPVDVVVVGAGPGGSCAAHVLATGGARVLILETKAMPRYKTCGGGLVRRAVNTLPVAVDEVVDSQCRHVTLKMGKGLSFDFSDSRPLISMTMRAKLDAFLTAKAQQAGAELRAPCRFQSLTEHRDGVVVETRHGPVRSRFVIGCDGANSSVARTAGWDPGLPVIPACEWEVYADGEAMDRFGDRACFDFDAVPGGYAWVFPKGDHLSIGVGRATAGPFGGPRLTERFLLRLGLRKLRGVERHGYVIPARPRPEGPARGRVLLAGDAAGLVDPVTWEGISYATLSGRLAAQAVLDADLDPHRARTAYREAIDREILADIRIGRLLAGLLYRRPRLRTWAFRHFGPRLCHGMIRVVSGRATYRELLSTPRNYRRLFSHDPARR